jgi:Zn-dependent protease
MSIITIVISLFVLLFAITVHEASHGWVAKRMGDPTAYNLGRVTLNPIAHIDPIGTILLPVVLVLLRFPAFGWAKPVPVNPFNLKDYRRDNLWISAAGPVANMAVALGSLSVIVILKLLSPEVNRFVKFGLGALPKGLHPLEGLTLILFYAVWINMYLAVFNLIPIPPLDGSGVLMGLLSHEAAQKYERIRPFGFIIVLALIYMGFLDLITKPIEIFINIILTF